MAFPRIRRRSTHLIERQQELFPSYNLDWDTLRGFLEQIYPSDWTAWRERRVSLVHLMHGFILSSSTRLTLIMGT